MSSKGSVSHGDLIVCACQGREYRARDAMEAALFRDDLATAWPAFLRRVATNDRADELDLELDEDALGTVAETFRYQHDLITAEETEQWLSARGLTLDEFSDYFVRATWGEKQIESVRPEKVDYVSA